MSDFAAAAMLRLVRLGLQRQGLATPALTHAREPAPALVPLQDKRALLTALMQQHCPAVLLRIGDAVLDAPDEPTLTALTLAPDPADLLARWQRLERFVHSRHRTRVLDTGPGRLRLQHVSLVPGQAPWPAEDLLVWGLLRGLMQRIGAQALRCDVDAQDSACASYHWCPALTPTLHEPPADALQAARAALAADVAAPWTLARLAVALGLSPRSLQRRLAADGSSFSALWTAVRLAQSARLLAEGPASTAQIGYCCGFADQAHFTRRFRQHTALTPARYRAEFSASR
ncbi:MAG: helix-turn-helix transcriptional regulator [Rubrivivax sp.]|nr:helix-turn-helix transcriptional regulator [Rubrivivax sp.]